MQENRDINIICKEKINFKRLRYTIDFINNHPLKPQNIKVLLNSDCSDCLDVLYSAKKDFENFIPSQNLFFSEYIPKQNELSANWYINDKNEIFSVEKIKKKKDLFYDSGRFGFDILEAIFFHISRYEEYYFSKINLDKHGRMKMQSQFLYKNNLHYQPVVDKLVFEFFKVLNYKLQSVKTGIILTHDIDIIRKFSGYLKLPKSIARILLMGKGLKGVFSVTKSYFRSIKNKNLDPYYTFDWLFKKDVFIDKIVFFVTGGKAKQDLYNKHYLKEMPEIIAMARSRGYKIGFHPSYNAFDDKKLFALEKELLEKIVNNKICYTRSHFLRLDIYKTFKIIEELGFEYDSTLGFAEDIGFRCGTGYAYHPYNFVKEKQWNFMEIPLVIMDSALLKKCKYDMDEFLNQYRRFLQDNLDITNITINIHNSTFEKDPFLV